MMNNAYRELDVKLTGKKVKMLLLNKLKKNKRTRKVDNKELLLKMLNKKVSSTFSETEMPETKL